MKKYTNDRPFEQLRQRILSREKNAAQVKSESVLSVALAFPNSYGVGMASLGFQSVYRIFNEFGEVRCERAFFDKSFPVRTKTIESGTELRHFDVVAFSISFELDIPNVVRFLMESGIEPLAKNRNEKEPLVLLGGTAAFMNPAPLSLFADIVVMGEIEPISHLLVETLLEYRKNAISRAELFEIFANSAGFYVPHFAPQNGQIVKVHADLKKFLPQYSVIQSPDSHFKDMFLLEVGRGCGRRCRFCAASHIYHPYRIFPEEKIIETIEENAGETKRVGLVGAALSDYPGLLRLCRVLADKGYELGLSSFRLDMITPEFLDIFERAQVNSIAFAPEAGSERLRKIINKNLSQEVIMQAAASLGDSNISHIKLYFLIGLPGETQNDIDAIVDLVKNVSSIFLKKNKKRKLTLSINAFIPKPWTPFQWAPLARPEYSRRTRKYISDKLKNFRNVEMLKKSSKEEVLQAVFSQGNEKVGRAVYLKIRERLSWEKAWEQAEVNVEKSVFLEKGRDYRFPWEYMGFGLRQDFLWKNWSAVSVGSKS
ncbi:MAG: radical SAM protein [Calditrichaeota bacterium]|nr:radical SAM protein [Calditrichota bacterium]